MRDKITDKSSYPLYYEASFAGKAYPGFWATLGAMKIAVFSTKSYDRQFLDQANQDYGYEITYFEARLNRVTVPLASGYGAVCAFVNDELDGYVLEAIAAQGTQLIVLRCAGFNQVDIATAKRLGLSVARVPDYSPYAVAEHTVGLILALNRKIHRAYARVRENNFDLEGMLGFDLHGCTVGIIGTGKIGALVSQILHGFGCRLIAYDVQPNPDCEALGVIYTGLEDLLKTANIVTLHCPLTPQTHHLIDAKAVAQMPPGVMLINTSRGALIDTQAIIAGLKTHKIGYLGLDVYEQEGDLFFENLSERVIQDDVFQRLLTFPNVLITGHQAFFTRNALTKIAETTLVNICAFEQGSLSVQNRVT